MYSPEFPALVFCHDLINRKEFTPSQLVHFVGMADPLSTIASIVALVGASLKAINFVRSKYRATQTPVDSLFEELRDLESMVRSLQAQKSELPNGHVVERSQNLLVLVHKFIVQYHITSTSRSWQLAKRMQHASMLDLYSRLVRQTKEDIAHLASIATL